MRCGSAHDSRTRLVVLALQSWLERRCREPIGHVPPAEYKQDYSLTQGAPAITAGITWMNPLTPPGRFSARTLVCAGKLTDSTGLIDGR